MARLVWWLCVNRLPREGKSEHILSQCENNFENTRFTKEKWNGYHNSHVEIPHDVDGACWSLWWSKVTRGINANIVKVYLKKLISNRSHISYKAATCYKAKCLLFLLEIKSIFWSQMLVSSSWEISWGQHIKNGETLTALYLKKGISLISTLFN